MAGRSEALVTLALLGLCCTVLVGAYSSNIGNKIVANVQWAPAAPGFRRALNFDVYLPAFPTARFTTNYRTNYVQAFKKAFPDAAWSITSVANSSRGVTVRTQAVFSANGNVQWLPSARRVYDMLRTGTCSKALHTGPWGLSSVQQVVFPYLISAGAGPDPYVPGSMILGLNLNLLLQTRTMNWLTVARANSMLKPLQNAQGTIASNLWKHTFVMPKKSARVCATMQTASLSARALASLNGQIKAKSASMWPASVWGPNSVLPGAQILRLGGQIAPPSPPPPARAPPPTVSPASPSTPAAPPTPISPTADVDIYYNGMFIARAAGGMIPALVQSGDSLEQCTEVPASDYPYTGQPIQVTLCGQALYGIYVGSRLVGFAPLASTSALLAVSGGQVYHASVEPGPLPPSPPSSPESPGQSSPESPDSPLPPDEVVEVRYGGRTVGSATPTTAPVIVDDGGGPHADGTVDLASYPYTGFAYEIQRDGRTLVSIYVGRRLVGFVPRIDFSGFSAVAGGETYRLTVPPLAPQPPLPPNAIVQLQYNGRTVGTTLDDQVPVIVTGDMGPVTDGMMNVADYPYTGYAYYIERQGQTLVSMYVGQRLVGFVPTESVESFTGFADGRTYALVVPPASPQPPLPPGAVVELVWQGQTVGATSGTMVPVLVDDKDGPSYAGSIDASSYPYTGYAYTLERDGQLLISVYVGRRLVGFMPSVDVADTVVVSEGRTYQLTAPPMPPQPPLPPDAAVDLVYDGRTISAVSGGTVPLIFWGSEGPAVDGSVDASLYPYAGYVYEIQRNGVTLVSVYVGGRLVGFMPKALAGDFSVVSGGRTYAVSVPPLPPLPPLPPTASVDLQFFGKTIGTTNGTQVPVLSSGTDGPVLVGTIDASLYPWTGYTYTIQRGDQTLVSVYVGQRLVGFVALEDVAGYTAFANGHTYDTAVPPVPPQPPLPPDSSVDLVYDGRTIATASGGSVPIVVMGSSGPVASGSVDASLYPYTGFAYDIERDGVILVSVYVGERLVGFMPKSLVGDFTAVANGQTYTTTVPPSPPQPPLPPNSPVELQYHGKTIASTSGDLVPLIVAGPDGPASVGTVDVSQYPYTGFSYTIERDGQTLVSVYVGQRLVGFVPVGSVGDYTTLADGRAYDLTVLPSPPQPPLPPGAPVDLVYDGRTIATASDGSVPLVIMGFNGPIAAGSVDASLYPYTGFAYEIQHEGIILVSVYVGARLVGFMPKALAGDFSAVSGNRTYAVSAPPSPPQPLPPTAPVDVQFYGKIIGTTDGAQVPVIVNAPNGPELAGGIDATPYPYTGYAYTIARDGQTLVSVYVGERLVGFVPLKGIEGFTAYAIGQTYDLTVPPVPPLPPTSPVDLVYGGKTIATASDGQVPLIFMGSNGPVANGTVNASDYLYTGNSYIIERDGVILVSVYVGERLVGFMPQTQASEFTAESGGVTYDVAVLPPSPQPPLSPDVPADLIYNGAVVGTASNGTVPLILNGPKGPVSGGTLNVADYPYTGFSYTIERDGVAYVSVYVGERLVGFMPAVLVDGFSVVAEGNLYDVSVPPSPPTPPLPPDALVNLVFDGETIGTASNSTVPLIFMGSKGPVANGTVNVSDYLYTGNSYIIERDGVILVSVYVGERLVGFMPQRQASEFTAESGGVTYDVAVLPPSPQPPLSPDVPADLIYNGAVVGTASNGTVPLILNGPKGPVSGGTLNVADYPYTGSSYTIERDGVSYVSVYVGERLVGFMPAVLVDGFSVVAEGNLYDVSVPPSPPTPPLPPDALVNLVFDGETIGTASNSTVPLIFMGSKGPVANGTVNVSDYLYTGNSYIIERDGVILVSVYVGERLVGFMPQTQASEFTAESGGVTYDVAVLPPSPQPPLSPDVPADLIYNGAVVGTASNGTVPLILNGPKGPVSGGTLNVADYPYTGSSYTIERDGVAYVSVYVGERLVGFMPAVLVDDFSVVAEGNLYDVSVPPSPPTPPLPPDALVNLVFDGETIGTASNSTVPLIFMGSKGPVANGTVNVSDYLYTGNSYIIERDGVILVSVYVGERLVGFMPQTQASEFTAESGGVTYDVAVLPPSPQPPLSPDVPADLIYNGAVVGTASNGTVPLILNGPKGPVSGGTLNVADYPYTGSSYTIERDGVSYVSVYVGERLVGFMPAVLVDGFSVVAEGNLYDVSVPPSPPTPPLPPDALVNLVFDGETIGTASNSTVPLIFMGSKGPVANGTVNVSDYLYTGNSYIIERDGVILVSVYVGERLVGFMPQTQASEFTAESGGVTYDVAVLPPSPQPPLSPDVPADLIYNGAVVGTASNGTVPLILNGPKGPVSGGTLNVADYPYTGSSYTIERDGVSYVSVYVGERLVGFMPAVLVDGFSVVAEGNLYDVSVPPSPPTPPLPPDALVNLVFDGETIGTASNSTVPLIFMGSKGPVANGTVNVSDYLYTGNSYIIERDGVILVSVYVGERLVGFMPQTQASEFTAESGGVTYDVAVLPPSPQPPLSPDVPADLIYNGAVVGTASNGTVPLILNGPKGPVSGGTLNVADYPYTGSSYTIERDGVAYVSVYVGERLVGFMPAVLVDDFSVVAEGNLYDVSVPPSPPTPPLPPDALVNLVFDGETIGTASNSTVPLIFMGSKGPVANGTVNVSDYLYTGNSYIIERDGVILVSVYVGERLVGFMPQTQASEFTAESGGVTYDVAVLPPSPQPPLSPDVPADLIYNGAVVGTASNGTVPLILNGPKGPVSGGTLNVADYPYTGSSYTIERDGVSYVSVYVGERLVGFMPAVLVDGFSVVAEGNLYDVSVPPSPPTPPLPPDALVNLVFDGETIGTASNSTVPLIFMGSKGPVANGTVNVSDYLYTGNSYIIERDGVILVSVYVGERLVGFMPQTQASEFTAESGGVTYDVAVLPPSPQPPLSPDVPADLIYNGAVVGTASNGTVPLILNGPKGPVSGGTLNVADYPYTGSSYTIERDGVSYVSVYVGERLVGFMPAVLVDGFSVVAEGNLYDVSVPPSPPTPPLPPDALVNLVFDGETIGTASNSTVPLIFMGSKGPVANGTVNVSDYLYTGNSYIIERDGVILVSVYVGERLVGFMPQTQASEFTAESGGVTYDVAVLPPSPQPPLSPDVPADLIYNGAVVGTASNGTVPLVLNGPKGPVSGGTLNVADYPYTGSSYTIERDGVAYVSVYVGERLVGFMPAVLVDGFSVVAEGNLYDVSVPPSPPTPPLPPDALVNLVFDGETIGTASNSTVPLIFMGSKGPVANGTVNASDYPYTGYSYSIERDGVILVSVYVGERLLGFMPRSYAPKLLAVYDGEQYDLTVLPDAPPPPSPVIIDAVLRINGENTGSATETTAPVIVYNSDGVPVVLSDVDVADYQYTGYSYVIVRNEQVLTSIYLDQRLVGFMPVELAPVTLAVLNGVAHDVTALPPAPQPPLPSGQTVVLQYHGAQVTNVATASGDEIPVIVDQKSTPVAVTPVSSSDYPFTGYVYTMVEQGQTLVSVYVGERLVGFLPSSLAASFVAVIDGENFDVAVPPTAPRPPLPSGAVVSLVYQTEVVASTADKYVPVIEVVSGTPMNVSTADNTQYPFTGYSYTIKGGSGEILTSVWVGARLVGFMPVGYAPTFTATADSEVYNLTVLPYPPGPPAPDDPSSPESPSIGPISRMMVWGSNTSGALATTTNLDGNFLSPGSSGLTPRQVFGGQDFACQMSGSVQCWGSNAQGKLGRGASFTDAYAATPAAVALVGSPVSMGAGANHACAVTLATKQTASCWGAGGSGRLGSGNTNDAAAPVQVRQPASTTFATIYAGGQHSCAITTEAAMYCWGSNQSGQLARPSTATTATSPVAIYLPSDATSVQWLLAATGTRNTCGSAATGTLYCWGAAATGINGNENLGTNMYVPVPVKLPESLVQLSMLTETILVVSTKGTGYIWGNNSAGQAYGGSSAPVQKTPKNWTTSVTYGWAGASSSCALMSSSKLSQVTCVGDNSHGQLGDGTTTQRYTPIFLSPPDGFSWTELYGAYDSVFGVQSGPKSYSPDSPADDASPDAPAEDASPDAPAEDASPDGPAEDVSPNAPAENASPDAPAEDASPDAPAEDASPDAPAEDASPDAPAEDASPDAPAEDASPDAPAEDASPDAPAGDVSPDAPAEDASPDAPADISPESPEPSVEGMYGWGSNASSALAKDSSLVRSTSPIPIDPPVDVVDGGADFACGLNLAEKSVYCWGANQVGQVGIGSTSPEVVETATKISDNLEIVSFTVGENFACFVPVYSPKNPPASKCWGSNAYGQLGVGDYNDRSAPTDNLLYPDENNAFTILSAGNKHACGITRAFKLYCWGEGEDGQLGNGGIASYPYFQQVQRPSKDFESDNIYQDVSCGINLSCALLTSGLVACFGYGENGAIGNGKLFSVSVPTFALVPDNSVARISARGSTAYAVKAVGEVYSWGSNDQGQIGSESITETAVPTPVLIIKQAVEVASAESFACALGDLGASYLACWGANAEGQLGLGDTNPRLSPTAVRAAGGFTWASIGLGTSASYGAQILPSPTPPQGMPTYPPAGAGLATWGANDQRQLGTGTNFDPESSSEPVGVSSTLTYMVSAGEGFACALEQEHPRQLWCWGANDQGQLAQSYVSAPIATPTQIAPQRDGMYDYWLTISAGHNHACGIAYSALLPDERRGYCWGSNDYGQLGNGTKYPAGYPAFVNKITMWSKLSAGYTHTCGIASNTSELYCVGDNTYGQLGVGSDVSSTLMKQVGSATWTEVSAGTSVTCGVSASAAYCWGLNDNGQLGSGSTDAASTPTLVARGTGFAGLSTWGATTCAISNTQRPVCWGDGSAGQMGDGNTNDVNTSPVQVSTKEDWALVSSGGGHVCGLMAGTGLVQCWGSNAQGALGVGSDTSSFSTPRAVAFSATTLSAKGNNTMATLGAAPPTPSPPPPPSPPLPSPPPPSPPPPSPDTPLPDEEGLYGWGSNENTALGLASEVSGTSTAARLPVGDLTAIEAGNTFACGLSADQAVYCWGNNAFGQVGSGSTTPSAVQVPVLVSGATVVAAFAAGYEFACYGPVFVSDPDSRVRCWGRNNVGQLGDGTLIDSATPSANTLAAGGANVMIDMSGGYDHMCGVSVSRQLYCWGGNAYGQVGATPSANSPNYNLVPAPANFNYGGGPYYRVASGRYYTCAVVLDGGVSCFGYGDEGALGDGKTTSRYQPNPAAVPGGQVVAMSAGGPTVYALNVDGVLFGWGSNADGTIGSSKVAQGPVATPVSVMSQVQQMSAGNEFGCAIGSSWGTSDLACWGMNAEGQLGIGNTQQEADPTPVPRKAGLAWSWVAAGEVSAYAFATNDAPAPASSPAAPSTGAGLQAWGANDERQLGTGSWNPAFVSQPINLGSSLNPAGVTAGGAFACTITKDTPQQVWCWGNNAYGQLGLDYISAAVPEPTRMAASRLGTFSSLTAVSAGDRHACGIGAGSGNAVCWGNNDYGQLGTGNKISLPTPVAVINLAASRSVTAGFSHSCAIRSSDKFLFCWGDNSSGQLGNGSTADSLQAAQVNSVPWDEVSAGVSVTCGVSYTNLYCWGLNDYGQLGIGDDSNQNTPSVVENSYSNVSSWGTTTCAINESNRPSCWGYGGDGQLGRGNNDNSNYPNGYAIFSDNVDLVVSAGDHVCARLTSTHAVYCWGSNSNGAVGVGTSTASYNLPQPLSIAATMMAARNGFTVVNSSA